MTGTRLADQLHAALTQRLAAKTADEKQAAEAVIARLLRAGWERIGFDAKQAQAGRDD